MKLTDSRGLAVSTQNAAALERYEPAARQTHGYFGNPLATLDEVLAEDPDFGMAHALRATSSPCRRRISSTSISATR